MLQNTYCKCCCNNCFLIKLVSLYVGIKTRIKLGMDVACLLLSDAVLVMLRCCVVLRCVALCSTVLRCVPLCCVVLRCVALCCVVLRCVALCSTVLHRVALCCVVLRCVAMFRTVLNYVALLHCCAPLLMPYPRCIKAFTSFHFSPLIFRALNPPTFCLAIKCCSFLASVSAEVAY